MRRRGEAGFGLLEVVVTVSLLALVLVVAVTWWQGHVAQQRLRYGTAQVAADLRQAQERAKAGRVPYTVIFAASSSDYTVGRSGGGFVEGTRLPVGVTAGASVVVTFSAFGKPDAAYTIVLQSSAGTGTATVSAAGGITAQEP